MIYNGFVHALISLRDRMKYEAQSVHTESWQSMKISHRPEAEMRELTNVYFRVPLVTEDLDVHRGSISPNLPWADRHFELERVSGQPINPGTTWREWPYALSADKFRREGEQFSHTYAERYWPRQAPFYQEQSDVMNRGIRYEYGDLSDVCTLLATQPLTRQAYLPVWFPEDTGVVHGERVPCTLGYHFLQRAGFLHVFYPIRSCDFVRHFRDDIYLTVRLLLWVLDRCRERNKAGWKDVKPGMFTMWAGSLHCFINDWRKL